MIDLTLRTRTLQVDVTLTKYSYIALFAFVLTGIAYIKNYIITLEWISENITIYVYRLKINATSSSFTGVYTCIAENRGGFIARNFTYKYG